MKKVSKAFYVGSFLFSFVVVRILTIVLTNKEPDIVFALLGLMSLAIMVFGIVVFLRLWYRAWQSVQIGNARTTPGRAVGLFCIPVFNFYWVFQLSWGFAKDYNSMILQRNPSLPILSEKLFLSFAFFFSLNMILNGLIALPAVVSLSLGLIWITIDLLVIGKLCDAINFLSEARVKTESTTRESIEEEEMMALSDRFLLAQDMLKRRGHKLSQKKIIRPLILLVFVVTAVYGFIIVGPDNISNLYEGIPAVIIWVFSFISIISFGVIGNNLVTFFNRTPDKKLLLLRKFDIKKTKVHWTLPNIVSEASWGLCIPYTVQDSSFPRFRRGLVASKHSAIYFLGSLVIAHYSIGITGGIHVVALIVWLVFAFLVMPKFMSHDYKKADFQILRLASVSELAIINKWAGKVTLNNSIKTLRVNDDIWPDVIEHSIRISDVFVIDISIPSEAIEWEVQQVNELKSLRKVIFTWLVSSKEEFEAGSENIPIDKTDYLKSIIPNADLSEAKFIPYSSSKSSGIEIKKNENLFSQRIVHSILEI